MKHVRGLFDTRRAADLALEHLVQEHGFERTDIFLQPTGAENSSGKMASGADQGRLPPEAARQALASAIEVSVDVVDRKAAQVCAVLREAGARHLSTR